jgi:hypothetical protein
MGGAETATGATRSTGEAQEAEVLGGRVEGHKGSHQKALGGLPQSQESGGVGRHPVEAKKGSRRMTNRRGEGSCWPVESCRDYCTVVRKLR